MTASNESITYPGYQTPTTRFDPFVIASWFVHKRSFSVIPLVGKVPLSPWKEFQTARPTDDQLHAWFGQDLVRNIGIVTGAISDVVVVDCDSREAIAWADANLPQTPMRTLTANGEHRGYQHPGGFLRNAVRIRTNDPRVKIDVRADGGYVVAPTSVHPTGKVYARLGEWPQVSELPMFDPAWLAPASATPPTPARVLRVDNSAPTLRRARAYLSVTPPAVQGQGGDHHTFVVACRLVRDFGLDHGDATALLREWNSTCCPPWSATDLHRKVGRALKYGRGSIGSKVHEDQRGSRL